MPPPPLQWTRRSALLGGMAWVVPTMGKAGPPVTATADGDRSLTAALQALVDDPQRPLTGLSVLCMQAGKTVFEALLGRRVLAHGAHPDLPVTRDTLFRMASVSKLVVALGIMRLVDAGKLGLDADVSTMLGFTLRHPGHPRAAITPRLLLSHRASISDDGGYRFDADVPLHSVLLPSGKHYGTGRSWLPHAPGTYFQYCNFNYGVLASVMERASGMRFDRLMQQEVLGPLGMQGGFDPSQFSDAELSNLATLYRKRSVDETWNTAGPWIAQTDAIDGVRPAAPAVPKSYVLGSNGTLFGPQGSLRTRVQDLAMVVQMLVRQGEFNGRNFLSRTSVQSLLTEQWRLDAQQRNGDSVNGMLQAWGLGLQHFIDRSAQAGADGFGDRLLQRGGVQAWGHLGDAYGLTSAVVFDPERGNGVIFAIGGTGANPEKHRAAYSSFSSWEARLLDLAWNRVL